MNGKVGGKMDGSMGLTDDGLVEGGLGSVYVLGLGTRNPMMWLTELALKNKKIGPV